MSLILERFAESKIAVDLRSARDPTLSLHHTLFGKSTATLAVRHSGFNSLLRWIKLHVGTDELSENTVYDFAAGWHKHLSTVQSGLSALNFVGGVLDERWILDIAGSLRVRGASCEKLATMPTRRQALALSPEQVMILEQKVCDLSVNFFQRQIAWCFLVMLSLRARFGDVCKLIKFNCSDDLIDVEPSRTKTSRRDTSRLPLTMLGPLSLSSGLPWFETHWTQREVAGIPADVWEFCPCFNGRSFANRPCCGADFNAALQSFNADLGIKEGPSSDAKLIGHSAKATALTFASSQGLSVQSRAILGYHPLPQESKAIRPYDRQRLLGPVLAFQNVLLVYASKLGLADNEPVQGLAEDDSVDMGADEEPVRDDSSALGSSSSSEEEDALEKCSDSRVILNEVRNTVHRGRFSDETRTCCGLVLRGHYRELKFELAGEIPGAAWCKRGCFAKSSLENDTDAESSD